MNKTWLHGLIGAFVGGFAGAIDSGLTLILIAPETFNLNAGLKKMLLAMTIFAVLSGYKTAAAYLKQSPTPWDGQSDRRGEPAAKLPGPVVPLILLALAFMPAMAQAQSGPTQDDVDAVFSAWGQHQAGLTVTFQNGPKGFMRLFCMFWCVPYLETPADYTSWNFGRVLSWPDPPDGSASARFPGQPSDCKVVNFRRSDNHILAGCGGTAFEPAIAPGGYRAFLAGLTPDARAKVIP